MKLVTLTTPFLCLATSKRQFSGDQVLRIKDPRLTEHHLHLLENNFGNDIDFWSDVRGKVDIHVSAEKLAAVKNTLADLDHRVMIEDLQELVDGEIEFADREPIMVEDIRDFNYTMYHTYEEIDQWVHEFAQANSDFCRVEHVGRSAEGREINALHISAHPQGHHEHAYFMMSGIHAREWIGPASTMLIIENMIHNYRQGHKQEQDILHNMDFYYIPVSNPDGYAYTWTDDRMWRKTRTIREGTECIGVDPNRNWPAPGWETGEGASDDPCSDVYRGPNPLSEPCVHAIDEWVSRVQQQHPIKSMFDIHSYSQLWLYPRGNSPETIHNIAQMARIGQWATDAIYDVHGTEFIHGPCYTTIYPATGITVDYMYDHHKIPCTVTPELRDTGRYGFLLPERDIRAVAEEMYPGYMLMGHAIMEGYCEHA